MLLQAPSYQEEAVLQAREGHVDVAIKQVFQVVLELQRLKKQLVVLLEVAGVLAHGGEHALELVQLEVELVHLGTLVGHDQELALGLPPVEVLQAGVHVLFQLVYVIEERLGSLVKVGFVVGDVGFLETSLHVYLGLFHVLEDLLEYHVDLLVSSF